MGAVKRPKMARFSSRPMLQEYCSLHSKYCLFGGVSCMKLLNFRQGYPLTGAKECTSRALKRCDGTAVNAISDFSQWGKISAFFSPKTTI